jgi:hypothetical protein
LLLVVPDWSWHLAQSASNWAEVRLWWPWPESLVSVLRNGNGCATELGAFQWFTAGAWLVP